MFVTDLLLTPDVRQLLSLQSPVVTIRTTNFSIQESLGYILPTLSISVVCLDLITNNDYFLTQHYTTDFIEETVCLLHGTN